MAEVLTVLSMLGVVVLRRIRGLPIIGQGLERPTPRSSHSASWLYPSRTNLKEL
jgi:hypothetical protein